MGSYDEFLSKLGWSEESEGKKNEKKGVGKPKSVSIDGQIKKCEDKIVTLESRIDANNLKLAGLAPSESLAIKEALALIKEDEESLNECYDLLSKLYQQT